MSKLSNKLSGLISLFVLGVSACADSKVETATPLPDVLVIENVTAIDVVNGVRSGMDVSVRNGEILSVKTHADDNFNAETRIDGTGKYLIPGLWDAHVHLTFTEGVDYKTFFPLSIAHGVTSLRDIGGHLDQLVDAKTTAATDDTAPNLYISGPLLDGPMRVYDGSSSFFVNISVGVSTVEEAVQQVDALAEAGVDFVKAYEMLEPDVFAAIVERAQHHNLPVAAHVPLSTTVRATASGIDDMQHLRNLEFACTDDRDSLLHERRKLLIENDAPSAGALRSKIHRIQRPVAISIQDKMSCDEAIKLLADNRVIQTPTMSGNRFGSKPVFADAQYRESFALMPPSIAEKWQNGWQRFTANPPSDASLAFENWMMDIVKRLHESGVPIMAGTDAPLGYQTPGLSLHKEMATMVEAGLTPLDAIGAATYIPATFFGIENEMGSIAPGMKADLVLLSADPVADINNIGQIESVLKSGKLIDRAELDTLLAIPASLGE